MGWLQRFIPARKPAQRTDFQPIAAAPDGVRVSATELLQLRFNARAVDLASHRRTASAVAGLQRSVFRGRGIDYQESRNYQQGDDIRAMDWRVTARTGRPHTKVYQEERERPVIVLVDLSPSMFFGTRTALKSVIAARAAALIGWATVGHHDRIGALLFDGGQDTCREIRPTGGRIGVLRLIRALVVATAPDRSDPNRESRLSEALKRLRRVARPGSLLVLLSDFYALDADSEQSLAQLRRHNDLLACHILDPLELQAPPPGRYGISDGRLSRVLDTASPSSRDAYAAHFARHRQTVQGLLQKYGVPLLRLHTTDDVTESLRRELAGTRELTRRGTTR
jgi:uncharacterized protein (DUF58 family)